LIRPFTTFRGTSHTHISAQSDRMHNPPMFPPNPAARASFKPGTVYAVAGNDDWVYFGQITPLHDFGFFRFRSRNSNDLPAALASDIMCRFSIATPSIGDALRQGCWQRLGATPLHSDLESPRVSVQWPMFSTRVVVHRTVTRNSSTPNTSYETTIDDPQIQEYEIAAVWDARHHVPPRLQCDFGSEPCDDSIGGPVWRQRRQELHFTMKFSHYHNRYGYSRDELLQRYGSK